MSSKKKALWVTLGVFALVISLSAFSTVVGVYAAPADTGGQLSESNNDSSDDGQVRNDFSVMIGSLTISLYEDKQDITAKLKETDLKYYECDLFNEKYDTYYMIDRSLNAYFKDGICVRLKFLNEVPQTARGIQKGDTRSRLLEQYGDFYKRLNLNYDEGRYDAYRFSFGDYFCEVGIESEYTDSVCNIDIYIKSLSPIYNYNWIDN